MDYAIVRPVSNSVLLSFFPSTVLPYLWLGAIPLNFMMVALYNRYLPKIGCWKVFLSIVAMIAGSNLISGLYMHANVYVSLLHFIWKEIYILLLFQTLWSLIHMTITPERAKSIYGITFGVGGLGTVAGSFVPGFFATELGSEALLFFTLPVLLCLSCCYWQANKYSLPLRRHTTFHRGGGEPASLRVGINLITRSRVLPYILLLVLCMQVASTLIDYQFNIHLQQSYPDKDLRTEFLGKMTSVVSSATVILQFLGSFCLLTLLGLEKTHFLIPIILGFNAFGTLIWPGIRTLAISFATAKVFDFSLFGIVKEMLYIPLSAEEKFQAKALIDVFFYRGAKALAALVILSLQLLQFRNLNVLTWICLSIFVIWTYGLKKLFQDGWKASQPSNG